MKRHMLYLLVALAPTICFADEKNDAEKAEDIAECKAGDKRNKIWPPTEWCPQINLFDPSARIYFDTGDDNPGEVDIFDDGSLNATIDFASLYFPFTLFRSAPKFTFGPNIGIGISGPAQDSEDGSEQASSAPVFLSTVGFSFNYEISEDNELSFEVGRAFGYSTDESFGDNRDSATYVGFKLKIDL